MTPFEFPLDEIPLPDVTGPSGIPDDDDSGGEFGAVELEMIHPTLRVNRKIRC
jgi:hypothetical protein